MKLIFGLVAENNLIFGIICCVKMDATKKEKRSVPQIIIVGFEYEEDLSACVTDIYHVYNFYKKLSYDIKIFSDVDKPREQANFTSLLTRKRVEDNFLPFLKEDFERMRISVKDKPSFENIFDMVPRKSERCLFYFSGHGSKDCILLPDGTKYPIIQLREKILELGKQILVVFDCCNPHGLFMPLLACRGTKKMNMISQNFLEEDVVVITSSEPDEKIKADDSGSPFTFNLFHYLKKRTKPYGFYQILEHMDKKLESSQKCSIYSSRWNKSLWYWCIDNKLSISTDDFLDCIVVKKLDA